MYIIIVGLGGIGRSLVGQAVRHSNNVVVVDQEESRCADILEHHDVLAITGNATDKWSSKKRGSTGPMRS
jgi:trk system potassium uptake protein TrkA